MIRKILKIIAGFLILGFLIVVFFYFQFKPTADPQFGVTYSHKYAQSLGLDPIRTYLDILGDLKPQKLRLVAYWDETERERGQYDFDIIERMLIEADKQNLDVIMAIGRKVPRWPECHQPEWYKSLEAEQQQAALLNITRVTVERLKQYSSIKAWQVENEPYFVFGVDCPKQNQEFLLQQVQAVKELDSRPVILTDSGEQGNWNQLADSGADIVGVTMYRTVYNDRWGYYKYPVGPWFYRLKAGVLKVFEDKPVIGVELQAEPWLLSGIFNTPLEEQKKLMNQNVLQEHVDYAKKSGFEVHYLWGVEWWYWMAFENDDWGLWTKGREVIESGSKNTQ